MTNENIQLLHARITTHSRFILIFNTTPTGAGSTVLQRVAQAIPMLNVSAALTANITAGSSSLFPFGLRP